jgi:hypothetical protein
MNPAENLARLENGDLRTVVVRRRVDQVIDSFSSAFGRIGMAVAKKGSKGPIRR